MVFLVLALADQKIIEDFKRWDVRFIFEYYSKAGPRSVNGMPMFMSLQYLDKTDTEKMFKYYDQIKVAMESI